MNLPDSNILGIIISVTLIYALLSILVSILVEARNYKTKARAQMLRESIVQLLNDPHNQSYGELFYNHFMINGLKSTSNRPPQYISSSMFADVLIDIIARQVEHSRNIRLVSKDSPNGKQYVLEPFSEKDKIPEDLYDRFKFALGKMNPSPFRDLLLSFCHKSNGRYEVLKPIVENWYNDYMDRVSGWYKTRLRKRFVLYGFVVALALNVDSIHLVRLLSLDDSLRDRLVLTAENMADQYSKKSTDEKTESIVISEFYDAVPDSIRKDTIPDRPKDLLHYIREKVPEKLAKRFPVIKDSLLQQSIQKSDSVLDLIAALNIPIGWSDDAAPVTWIIPSDDSCDCKAMATKRGLMSYIDRRNNCPDFFTWFWYIVGICITGISLSFGAPFWFELLVKVVNIRRAGVRPQTKQPTDPKQ